VSWSRTLTHVLKDKRGAELRTLHCARTYLVGLKSHTGQQRHWQHAAALLLAAADGGDIEACTQQIYLAMFLDGVLDLEGTWP
jgi:hypothetical protein